MRTNRADRQPQLQCDVHRIVAITQAQHHRRLHRCQVERGAQYPGRELTFRMAVEFAQEGEDPAVLYQDWGGRCGKGAQVQDQATGARSPALGDHNRFGHGCMPEIPKILRGV